MTIPKDHPGFNILMHFVIMVITPTKSTKYVVVTRMAISKTNFNLINFVSDFQSQVTYSERGWKLIKFTMLFYHKTAIYLTCRKT